MKCKHWETVFAVECPEETKIKNKEKPNKGIPCKLAHNEKCMAAVCSAASVLYSRVL